MSVMTTSLVRRVLAEGSTVGGVAPRLGAEAAVPRLGAEALVGVLREAGLTGRGGAGFPVWRKVAAVAASGRPAVVIGNGAEGEPGSAKDRVLLSYRPDLVVEGLQIVAGALGARAARLYLPADLRARLDGYLRTRRDPVAVTTVVAAERFVAGEATAVAQAVAGRGSLPADKVRRLSGDGVLVQNVETLAHLALIVRHGPEWFRAAGTADEPGTFLATVGGAVGRSGVLEAGYGVTLGELVDAAGGATMPIQAVLVGGYHGAWLPARPELRVSRAGLAEFGASPGAGVVQVLPATTCGLAETARITGYLAGQTAGQCGPCVNGLPRLADTLTELAEAAAAKAATATARPAGGERVGAGLVEEVARLAGLVDGRGACHHPDGTVRLIRSSLRVFAADVQAHLRGHCLADGGHR